MHIIEGALRVLKTREFVALATADKKGRPNSAPKFLLKVRGRTIYFVDYNIGHTAENLNVNPEVSLSFIDIDSLVGYRLNGKAQIIKKGAIYDECLNELQEKEIELSAERIVQGVHENKPHKEFELDIPEHFLVYKITIEEGSKISPHGEIIRENGKGGEK